MTTQEKKQMYNRIMEATSQMVVKMLNEEKLDELYLSTVRNAYNKRRKYSGFARTIGQREEYSDYDVKFDMRLQNKIVPFFDYVRVMGFMSNGSNDDINPAISIIYGGDDAESYYINVWYNNIDEESDAFPMEDDEDFYLEDMSCGEEFESFVEHTPTAELLRALSIRDAKRLSKMIKEQTGLNLSYRNFAIDPLEINRELDSNVYLEYLRKKENN